MGVKRAFSLVELIFTIILLGIVFVTVASLLFKSAELDIASLEGEALYRAAALMQRVTAQPHNSALLGDLNTSVSAASGYPDRWASAGRIADYTTFAAFDQDQCRGFASGVGGAWVTGTGRQGETTVRFAGYINDYVRDLAGLPPAPPAPVPPYPPMPVRFVRVCAGPTLAAGAVVSPMFAPDLIVAAAATNQLAINEWNGFRDDHDRFVLTVSVEPFNEPDPRTTPAPSGNAWDVLTDWGDMEGVTGSNIARNLLVIKVTATEQNTGEVIGELRYVASNIGALQ